MPSGTGTVCWVRVLGAGAVRWVRVLGAGAVRWVRMTLHGQGGGADQEITG